MKEKTIRTILERANASLTPEMVNALNDAYLKTRAVALKERNCGDPVTIDNLNLTSTAVKFKVSPDHQEYK